MKITVAITGTRNDTTIEVPLAATTAGQVEFNVPNVGRASACTFSVNLHDLRQALDHLENVPATPATAEST